MLPSPTTMGSTPSTMLPCEETPGLWLFCSSAFGRKVVCCVIKGRRLCPWSYRRQGEGFATDLRETPHMRALAKKYGLIKEETPDFGELLYTSFECEYKTLSRF